MGGRLTTASRSQWALNLQFGPLMPKVSLLVGDFNYWDGRVNPMRVLGYSGIWEIFIPGLGEGEKYKFEIQSQQGETS